MADGDFRAGAQVVHRPAWGDARRVPLNAALVLVVADERAAAEEVGAMTAGELQDAVEVAQVPSRRVAVLVPMSQDSRMNCHCCWCWG